MMNEARREAVRQTWYDLGALNSYAEGTPEYNKYIEHTDALTIENFTKLTEVAERALVEDSQGARGDGTIREALIQNRLDKYDDHKKRRR